VLCVTHLAQVAAQAEHHFAVNKTLSGGRTSSQINALAGGARVDELARMLGGIEITPTTRKHARELLAAVS
jgi:DNA repair protein RecN (Recombination protein N)